jgi:hypothetical protein
MGRWLMSTCVGMLRGLVDSTVLGLCVLVEVRLEAAESWSICFKLRLRGGTSGLVSQK